MSASISTPSAASLRPRDLAVDLRGDRVHARARARAVAHELLGAQRLQRERHVHHRGRMALGGGEVDDAAAGEQVQPAVAEVVLLDERAAPRARRRSPASRRSRDVDLDVEVAGVGQHRAVLHALEVLAASARRARR